MNQWSEAEERWHAAKINDAVERLSTTYATASGRTTIPPALTKTMRLMYAHQMQHGAQSAYEAYGRLIKNQVAALMAFPNAILAMPDDTQSVRHMRPTPDRAEQALREMRAFTHHRPARDYLPQWWAWLLSPVLLPLTAALALVAFFVSGVRGYVCLCKDIRGGVA